MFPTAIPTTVHITHGKAGSTWLDRIFRQLFGPLVAPRGEFCAAEVGGDLSRYVFPQGRFYSAMFLSREQFLSHAELQHSKRFVVIRDIRDTLISLYFSQKVSHPLDQAGQIAQLRSELCSVDKETGILSVMERRRGLGQRQVDWVRSGEMIYRYEDLIMNDIGLLQEILIDRLALPVTPERVKEVVLANRFEARFKRKLGTEDVNSHGRQGAPGNWRKHFTPGLSAEFIRLYGDVLIETGYEKDHSWASEAGELLSA